ncbi:glycosyltransferase family 2 protein [Methyloceanibacter caenitepidi]|uniref:Glycosyl transferase, family 2 n=1 Tax=Methyloceanibacter caenitepidi TaxID=1384459 RepID=A0A0A8JZG1_9HYPH|nr:glycosyltransferase family 2 protein [Methyloceanibacter caenitepidi]BAQ15732.1 glycosyl transferase, family 2 [Methyloceanibacter caenitepidi]
MTSQPAVTIVTPCLNRADMIAAAVESVRDQDFDGRIEHLVMDGGSTDGTLDLLKCYPEVTVVSEPDNGLYDALNKGIARAQASIVGLLNSDDVYRPHAVRKAVAAFSADPAAAMVCGGADILEGAASSDTVIRRYDNADNRNLDPQDLLLGVPIVNARFYRRALFDQVGLFDTRYKIVADRDFLLRAALADAAAAPIEGVVYAYGSHGGSLTIGGIGARRRIAEESIEMAEDWLGRTPQMSAAAARSMKRLHAQCTLICVADSLRRGDVSDASRWAGRAMRSNGLWPVSALGAVGAWAVRRMRLERV